MIVFTLGVLDHLPVHGMAHYILKEAPDMNLDILPEVFGVARVNKIIYSSPSL